MPCAVYSVYNCRDIFFSPPQGYETAHTQTQEPLPFRLKESF